MPMPEAPAITLPAAAPGHRGTRAIQRMVEFAPSTGGLALWVRHEDLPERSAVLGLGPEAGVAADAPAAAPVSTDGKTIFYAPQFVRLPLGEQVGWVAHEVLHVALRHPQRYLDLRASIGDVDLELFNLCADAIVNSSLCHLSWLKLAPSAVLLDKLLGIIGAVQAGLEKALLEWDVERLYRALDDRPHRAKDGTRSARARSLANAADADLKPSQGSEGAPEMAAERTREWSERVMRAHAGDGEFSMLRTLLADLPRTRTPWEQVLRTLLARSLAPQRALSWSRPTRSYIANQGRMGAHRRLPWEPGFSGTKAVPRLVVIVDVSGSIEDRLLQRFAREIESITRRLEAGLVLIVGDDRVQRIARFEPGRADLGDIEFRGGGGTDFTPLLVAADEHRPDIGVVLTDLDGPSRFEPRWPVLWAVPEAHRAAVAPFGRKLVLT
jgi:predicted metal-dependent peptidase